MTGPLFSKPGRGLLIFWTTLAILNLTAGVVISMQPARITDLESIMQWGGGWLGGGENIYDMNDTYVDYPPNAMVMLSPLSLLPMSVAVPFWMLLNIALACLAPYLTARFFRPHDPFSVIALPILMFLCWGGLRALTQFSLLAFTFSMAALVLADQRPTSAGALMGLAMMKPQVALPVFLWSVFTRRWRIVWVSVAAVTALFAMYCLWAGAGPLSVVERYAGIIALHHTGDAPLAGTSELRPLIQELVSDVSDVDVIAGSIAIGLLAAICLAGWQEGSARTRVLYAAPPLAACWCLLTFYHLTYGFIILLPVLMLLTLNDAPPSMLRKTLLWVLQLGMMFDIPGLSRRAGLANEPVYDVVLVHADRGLVLALVIGLAVLAWSEPPETADPTTVR